MIEIIKAGEYTLPGLPNNVTIEGTVDGVVFNHTTNGNIASIPSGATFKNVTFNFGNVNYHGFQHAGTIDMEGCTLNGKLFSYGNMNFTNCTFEQSNEDYHMWVYGGGTVNYTGCTFNGIGKFLNLYQEDGNVKHFVNVDNCTFNSSKKNKAALNVKATCGTTQLQYAVNITNCKTNDNFPEASTSDALVVLNGLVQVDDRTADGVDKITVTQDGKKIYPVSYVAQIGDVKYETLAKAFTAATDGQTITVLTDIDLLSTIAVTKQVSLDLPERQSPTPQTFGLGATGRSSLYRQLVILRLPVMAPLMPRKTTAIPSMCEMVVSSPSRTVPSLATSLVYTYTIRKTLAFPRVISKVVDSPSNNWQIMYKTISTVTS